MIDFGHLTDDYLAACAESLGLRPDAFTARRLAYLAERIDDSGGPESCWPWGGPRQGAGYGVACVGGTTRGPHRLVHVLIDGPLASRALLVRHDCDTPPCANPAHLRRGTARDNTADALSRGHLRGRVLTAEDREFLPGLVDRFTRASARRGGHMTRPEVFAVMAQIFEVSAGRAGSIYDASRRAARAAEAKPAKQADRDREPAA